MLGINNDNIGTEISIALDLNQDIAFVEMVKCCTKHKDLHKGIIIHDAIVRRGLLEKSPYIASALINMYAKSGVISKAMQVLEEISARNVVHWNALIAGYTQEGHVQGAILCLSKMQHDGLSPDTITFILILKACAKIKAVDVGEQIHEKIMEKNLLEKDIMLGNTLVDMYAKCGRLAKAKKVLEELPYRNVVSWNALISGYVQQEKCHEALHYFQSMQREGISPDAVTFVCVLQACGKTRCIDKGKQIHDVLVARGLLGKDIVLGNALLDMYVKCKDLSKATQVLHELPVRDVVCWSALISGYANHGHLEMAKHYFQKLWNEGIESDIIAFLSLIYACSHSGLLQEGCFYFRCMMEEFALLPTMEHYACVIDMFGRAGLLNEAEDVIGKMPFAPDSVVWKALLSSCVRHTNVNVGTRAFNALLKFDCEHAAGYVLMSNIHVATTILSEDV